MDIDAPPPIPIKGTENRISDSGIQDFADDDENKKEWQHWYDVMRTFLLYEDFIGLEVRRMQNHVNRLSQSDIDHLPTSVLEKPGIISNKAKINQKFFYNVVDFQDFGFYPRDKDEQLPSKFDGPKIPASQMHKNQAVLHSLVREWSSDGACERQASFMPLRQELLLRLPVNEDNAYQQRVVVPGCGLARLAVEIVSEGYSCQANEFSMFMLTASHYVLNGVSIPESVELFPWIDKVCNVRSMADNLRPVRIPDRTAPDILSSGRFSHLQEAVEEARQRSDDAFPYPSFSMAAGDFVVVYGDDENACRWDAVVTCFFLDTAPVVMDYIRTIWHMLRPGGFWINVGPLLYHWADDPGGVADDERYDQSIELTYDEVKSVIESYGFVFLKEEWNIECNYTCNQQFMMMTTYKPVFFTVQKPFEIGDNMGQK